MSYNEILAELKGKLGNSPEENDKFLRTEFEKYAKDNNTDGMKAASELLLENMSEEQREEIKRITHVDSKRLDELHSEIVRLINEHKSVDAKPLAERLYKKITVEFKETDKEKFVSLRNPFEDNLYQLLFKPEKKLNRTPFDFAAYLTTYGYILVETGSPLDAIPILKQAIEYNPVDVGPKFELAEVYKLLGNKQRLLEITRETLKVASSPVAIARCYANVGYILVTAQEYEDAAAFYTASAMMDANPAIPHELRHVADLKGTPIKQYTHSQIADALNKYDIALGPSQDVIKIAAELASYYLTNNDIPNAVKALKITYVLTLDEKIKNLILKYDPESARKAEEAQKPNIKQTINNNPEE